jgi:hypothetical protein
LRSGNNNQQVATGSVAPGATSVGTRYPTGTSAPYTLHISHSTFNLQSIYVSGGGGLIVLDNVEIIQRPRPNTLEQVKHENERATHNSGGNSEPLKTVEARLGTPVKNKL